MATRLVVFDVAGTTVRHGNGAVQRSMRAALNSAGLEVRDGALDGVTGLSKRQAIRTLVEGHGRDELLDQVDAIHNDFVARMIQYYRDDPGVAAVDGATASFEALRQSGIKVALNTGFPRDVLDVILHRMGWVGPASPIDASISSEEVNRGRPYPDMIDTLRHRLGSVDPGDVVKVGDTPVDLQEGVMARCGAVIGVLTGSHTRASLQQHHHDVLLDSVAAVPEWLREQAAAGA